MIDFRQYITFSEKYLQLAKAENQKNLDTDWLLIPALTFAWSAMELFVNNMLDDFSSLPEDMFQMHERAFLLEKRLRFNNTGTDCGNFTLENTEYRSLEDKILFLIAKAGKGKKIRESTFWSDFIAFKKKRDSFIHPSRNKEEHLTLTIKEVELFISTSKQVIQLVSSEVWKKEIEF